MLSPGDVVIMNFVGVKETKKRPTVVISTALYHSTCPDVVLAVLTKNTLAAAMPSDYILQDWSVVGLNVPSAFRAFIRTETRPHSIIKKIGSLPVRDWQEVQARLRIAPGGHLIGHFETKEEITRQDERFHRIVARTK